MWRAQTTSAPAPSTWLAIGKTVRSCRSPTGQASRRHPVWQSSSNKLSAISSAGTILNECHVDVTPTIDEMPFTSIVRVCFSCPFSMDELRLPSAIENSQRILVAGAGGGFDVYAGPPLYECLRLLGKKVYLANLSFVSFGATYAHALTGGLYAVEPARTGKT